MLGFSPVPCLSCCCKHFLESLFLSRCVCLTPIYLPAQPRLLWCIAFFSWAHAGHKGTAHSPLLPFCAWPLGSWLQSPQRGQEKARKENMYIYPPPPVLAPEKGEGGPPPAGGTWCLPGLLLYACTAICWQGPPWAVSIFFLPGWGKERGRMDSVWC